MLKKASIIAIIFTLLFTACTKSINENKAISSTNENDKLQGTLEIAISDDKFGEFIKYTLGKEFTKKNPKVTVKVVSDANIDSKIISGNPPDVYIGNNLYEAFKYGRMDKLLDFKNFKAFKVKLESNIDKRFICEDKNNNKIYSIPWLATTQLMAYNKALFREAALDEERPPKTFQEVITYADRISKLPQRADGSKVYGIGGIDINNYSAIENWNRFSPLYYNINDNNYGLYNMTGTDIVFDKPEAKMEELFLLAHELQQFSGENKNNQSFSNTGMWLQYGDEVNSDLQDVGFAAIPVKDKNSVSYSTIKQKNIMICKTNKERENLAWNFVKFMMDEEENLKACKELKQLPVVQKLQKNNYFKTGANKKYLEAFKNAIEIEPYPSIEEVVKCLQSAYINYAMNKNITPNSAVTNAANKAREIIKK